MIENIIEDGLNDFLLTILSVIKKAINILFILPGRLPQHF